MNNYYRLDTYAMGFPELFRFCFSGKAEEVLLSDSTCEAVPVAASFKKPFPLRVDKRFPGMKLTGLLRSSHSKLVLHKSYCDVLREFDDQTIEFIPCEVLNHKGRVASRDYEIVHVIGLRDVLDYKKSEIVWKERDGKREVCVVKKEVFDGAKIDPRWTVFRILGSHGKVYISSAVAEKWQAVKHEEPFIFVTKIEVTQP